MKLRTIARLAAMVVACVTLTLVSCSSGSGTSPAASMVEHGSARSQPFAAGPAPDGFELVVAGIGTAVPAWGEDSSPTDSPQTILAPTEKSTWRSTVLVETTSWRETQPRLWGTSKAAVTDFVKAHRAGKYWNDGPEPQVSSIRSPQVQVWVRSAGASRAQLLDLEGRVEISSDLREAPKVPHPPPGLRVVGSVDVDALLTVRSLGYRPPEVPGMATTHTLGWQRGGVDLVVQVLPGRSLDLAAVRVRPLVYDLARLGASHPVRVGRRRGMFAEEVVPGGPPDLREVVAEGPEGQMVVLSATAFRAPGTSLPTEDELIAMAASVRPVSDVEWRRTVASVPSP